MPTYEYKCESGHEFEVSQPITDDALSYCMHQFGATDAGMLFCNAPCKRLISNTSFKFKGGAPTPKHYH